MQAPQCKVEVLTPDFRGQEMPLAKVIAERPDVFNHNCEVVPRLYPVARRGSEFLRSARVLEEREGDGRRRGRDEVRPDGRPRRDARGDGRDVRDPARAPRAGADRRPVPAPDRAPPADRALLAPGRVQGAGGRGLRARLRPHRRRPARASARTTPTSTCRRSSRAPARSRRSDALQVGSARRSRWTSRRRSARGGRTRPTAPSRSTARLLDELLELATWAPNHHLTNPWRFRVLGPQSLAALKQAAGPEAAAKLDRAPTLVCVSVVQRRRGGERGSDSRRGGPARRRLRRLRAAARRARARARRLLAHARACCATTPAAPRSACRRRSTRSRSCTSARCARRSRRRSARPRPTSSRYLD